MIHLRDSHWLAELLKKSRDQIDQMRLQGKGPRYIKIGRRVYYDERDVLEYIESNKVETIDSIEIRENH